MGLDTIVRMFTPSKSDGGRPIPQPTPPPPAPTRSSAEDEAKKKVLARKRSNTILTSPMGVTEAATVKKPTLLGTEDEGKTTLG